ncbi:MAG: hypothetical protein QXT61_00970 [Candidatus Caldarchaeum sp.]
MIGFLGGIEQHLSEIHLWITCFAGYFSHASYPDIQSQNPIFVELLVRSFIRSIVTAPCNHLLSIVARQIMHPELLYCNHIRRRKKPASAHSSFTNTYCFGRESETIDFLFLSALRLIKDVAY